MIKIDKNFLHFFNTGTDGYIMTQASCSNILIVNNNRTTNTYQNNMNGSHIPPPVFIPKREERIRQVRKFGEACEPVNKYASASQNKPYTPKEERIRQVRKFGEACESVNKYASQGKACPPKLPKEERIKKVKKINRNNVDNSQHTKEKRINKVKKIR